MSLYKLGKNRKIDLLSNRLYKYLRIYRENYRKITKGIYFYELPSNLQCNGDAYKFPIISTRKMCTKYMGYILGIIPDKLFDANGDSIGEFYWFNDVKEYTDDELDLLDEEQIDLPVCAYSYGVNKRATSFI